MQSSKVRSVKGNAAAPAAAISAPQDVQEVMASGGVLAGINIAKKAFSRARKQLLESVVTAYSVAHYLREHPETWAMDVCSLPDWAQFKGRAPDPSKPHEALHYVMRLAVGFSDKQELKRASEYTLALQSMFDQHLNPADVAQRVREAGGLKELSKRQAQRSRVGRSPSSAAQSTKKSLPSNAAGDWVPAMMMTFREFEVSVIQAFLDDYEGIDAEQAGRLRAGLRSLLSHRVRELRDGARANPLFDSFTSVLEELDSERRAVAYGTPHSPTDPKIVN
ncbi:hypothetical protein DEVEQU_00465 [Devosia equisanguinis]|uniref:Uncharacterized protein n=1 Tax=Devosia equisanguinis TaxID=2490941 RepID=A0A3S4GHN2_9HYPH|nr:hypothetical protein [Devosia equisanguinis]VDS03344.1 hypothetical protein DEVEQU_00465 [Devosia equisanguinis]